ncbi:MAG: hypothetical protein ABL995_12100 [Bryobacteraceae bacterium]
MEDIREIVQAVVKEFLPQREEMEQERARRMELEQRVNELIAENEKSRVKAEEAERSSAIRAELQKLGVAKLDLAFRAVRDDISRSEDGSLVAAGGVDATEYLTRFVMENPELLPARLVGGSGAGIGQRGAGSEGRVDLDRIRPGMNPEELDRVRQEIARVASQTLRGQ